jgi:hypothetical protein
MFFGGVNLVPAAVIGLLKYRDCDKHKIRGPFRAVFHTGS